MYIKQFEAGSFMVFAYLVGCKKTGEGIVIDPADDVDFIVEKAKQKNITIKYLVNTHTHFDHTMGNAEMVKKTKAKIIVHELESANLTIKPRMFDGMFKGDVSPTADILVKDNDMIKVGDISVKVLHTPGHSPGGISLYVPGYVFTGDSLFVGAVGRTDFPGSSFEVLSHSIKTRLYTLPENTVVLPGHNYGATKTSTIGNEKMYNPFVRVCN
ncbi:MAG: MBL fold metallo-hydrolase [Thermodesulfobacteriota bacterium]|nr:MBL fold metallo-hydrolase [Thermodesulfobacteriota bacterium]